MRRPEEIARAVALTGIFISSTVMPLLAQLPSGESPPASIPPAVATDGVRAIDAANRPRIVPLPPVSEEGGTRGTPDASSAREPSPVASNQPNLPATDAPSIGPPQNRVRTDFSATSRGSAQTTKRATRADLSAQSDTKGFAFPSAGRDGDRIPVVADDAPTRLISASVPRSARHAAPGGFRQARAAHGVRLAQHVESPARYRTPPTSTASSPAQTVEPPLAGGAARLNGIGGRIGGFRNLGGHYRQADAVAAR